ncbi:hypothetical protein [Achromobacter sp. 413638]|uniref:hypothetical protein n=1 Tax=Achromobacter sp. 413638 TaxID=3342385 RepID=UPI00370A00DE
MIPVSLPGGNFYVLMAVSLACLSTLLTWLAVLATSRGARHWLGGHRRLGTILMTALALLGAIFPYQQLGQWLDAERDAQADAGRRSVLNQPTRVAGVDMPAGTVLRLATPGELSTFDRARFPDGQPGLIHGLESTGLYRYAATARQPETLSVEIARDQAQEGWLCAHGHRVEFVMLGGQPRFASCHLAIGNQLDRQPVPPGTWIQVDPAVRGQPIEQAGAGARWLLRTEGSEPMEVERLSLLKLELRLDARRQLLGFEGLLSRETALGDMTYPAGTRVLSGGLRAAGAQPGDLLFSASRGRVARRAGGTDVAAGSSVLQAPDGAVRAVLSNRDAGVLDVAAVRVGP